MTKVERGSQGHGAKIGPLFCTATISDSGAGRFYLLCSTMSPYGSPFLQKKTGSVANCRGFFNAFCEGLGLRLVIGRNQVSKDSIAVWRMRMQWLAAHLYKSTNQAHNSIYDTSQMLEAVSSTAGWFQEQQERKPHHSANT